MKTPPHPWEERREAALARAEGVKDRIMPIGTTVHWQPTSRVSPNDELAWLIATQDDDLATEQAIMQVNGLYAISLDAIEYVDGAHRVRHDIAQGTPLYADAAVGALFEDRKERFVREVDEQIWRSGPVHRMRHRLIDGKRSIEPTGRPVPLSVLKDALKRVPKDVNVIVEHDQRYREVYAMGDVTLRNGNTVFGRVTKPGQRFATREDPTAPGFERVLDQTVASLDQDQTFASDVREDEDRHLEGRHDHYIGFDEQIDR